jgi:hypothetical protein
MTVPGDEDMRFLIVPPEWGARLVPPRVMR